MNTHQIVATITELVVVIGGVWAVVYVTWAADEAKMTYEATMATLTSGPTAPAMEASDEFIRNFVAGEIENAMREKHGRGLSD